MAVLDLLLVFSFTSNIILTPCSYLPFFASIGSSLHFSFLSTVQFIPTFYGSRKLSESQVLPLLILTFWYISLLIVKQFKDNFHFDHCGPWRSLVAPSFSLIYRFPSPKRCIYYRAIDYQLQPMLLFLSFFPFPFVILHYQSRAMNIGQFLSYFQGVPFQFQSRLEMSHYRQLLIRIASSFSQNLQPFAQIVPVNHQVHQSYISWFLYPFPNVQFSFTVLQLSPSQSYTLSEVRLTSDRFNCLHTVSPFISVFISFCSSTQGLGWETSSFPYQFPLFEENCRELMSNFNEMSIGGNSF